MNNSSLPMIFLLLAIAGLVFGIGVVAISRRKARAVPQIQRAAPVKAVSQVVSADVIDEIAVVAEVVATEVVAAAPLSVRDRLAKARSSLSGAVGSVLGRSDINDSTWLELEEALLRADVGVRVAQSLLGALQTRVKAKEITTPAQLIDASHGIDGCRRHISGCGRRAVVNMGRALRCSDRARCRRRRPVVGNF